MQCTTTIGLDFLHACLSHHHGNNIKANHESICDAKEGAGNLQADSLYRGYLLMWQTLTHDLPAGLPKRPAVTG